MENIWYFIALALLAEVLGTVGGFGSSLFFVPIASYFLDFHSVLGITALFHVSSNLAKIALFRKGFNKKLIIQIGIPAVVFVVIGAYMSQFLQTKYLEGALAIFLITASLLLLLIKDIEVKPTSVNAISGGVLSGLIAGLLGTGGAIRGTMLAAYNLRTEVFIATSAIIDLAIDASRSVVYVANGYMTDDLWLLVPVLLIVSIAGTYIGKRILNYISEEQFKKIVLLLILLTGIVTAYRLFFK